MWVDEWQMECCGEPFHVGSTVTWTLTPADREWLTLALGAETAATIDWGEDHHGDPSPGQISVEAQVTHISVARVRWELAPGGDVCQPAGGRLYPQPVADGRHPAVGDLKFAGYVVTLESHRQD
ncbi:hypothetical protein GCM10009850_072660 [Nonomuraea monospora]|uniref:Uncharacterized protein n=1 Tax=Nonomuraea monospora TaxID=568818 RepID=A0ABP5PKX3_9ACTN